MLGLFALGTKPMAIRDDMQQGLRIGVPPTQIREEPEEPTHLLRGGIVDGGKAIKRQHSCLSSDGDEDLSSLDGIAERRSGREYGLALATPTTSPGPASTLLQISAPLTIIQVQDFNTHRSSSESFGLFNGLHQTSRPTPPLRLPPSHAITPLAIRNKQVLPLPLQRSSNGFRHGECAHLGSR